MPTIYNARYCALSGALSSKIWIARNSGLHQYRTGKTLGSGTYAIVKEAIHIKTGKYYACKVINKKLMEGREHMVRWILFSKLDVLLIYTVLLGSQ